MSKAERSPSKSKNVFAGLEVPKGVAITGIAAAAVILYEVKRHKKKRKAQQKTNTSEPKPPESKKFYRQS